MASQEEVSSMARRIAKMKLLDEAAKAKADEAKKLADTKPVDDAADDTQVAQAVPMA